jgi:hypothetical protein
MSKLKLAIALSTLIAASGLWAVPLIGTAHDRFWRTETFITQGVTVGAPVRLKQSSGRGLLADVWIRGTGPFTFAVDTGAGITLVSRSAVNRTQLQTHRSTRPLAGGLSAGSIISNQSTTIPQMSIGRRDNQLHSSFTAAVVESLPSGIDGILDPTSAFQPYGYSIDLPNRELRVLDFTGRSLQTQNAPRDGAIVKWIRNGADDRPFVRLGDGRLALIDTGSGFGLAVSDGRVVSKNHNQQDQVIRDLAGGSISARRVDPVTVNIGALELKSVPTDFLFGAPAGTPVIIGRDALYPFRLTFDPTSRLIEIAPVQ